MTQPQLLEINGVTYEKLFDEPILGVPFKGVYYLDGADLEGDEFDPNYDRGDLPFVLSYMSHAKSAELGNELIGMAQFVERDEYGDWFDHWVRQDSIYKDGLRELKKRGMVRSSSYPFQRTVQIEKSADGKNVIKRWHVTELTLTPSSMSPAATFRSQIQDLQKSVESVLTLEDIINMAKEKQEEKDTTTAATETVTTETTEETDLAAGAIAALNGATEDKPEGEEETASVVDVIMKAITDFKTEILERLDAHEKAVDSKVTAQVTALGGNFSKAMTEFGSALSTKLTGEYGKSTPQRKAEEVIKEKQKAAEKDPAKANKTNGESRVAPGGPQF